MEEKGTKDGYKVYEIGFHVAPIVGDQGVSHEVGEIKNLLDAIKAEIISEDFPRLRPLAYPLSKVIGGSKKVFKEAYFGWIKFEADSLEIEEFKSKVEKLENLVRFLIVKTVRENTLYGNKFAVAKEKDSKFTKKNQEDESEEKEEINPEELDKSIEELVV